MPSRIAALASVGVAMAALALAGAQAPALTRGQVSEDIATFRAALEELHPSLVRYSSPRDIEAFFAQLDREIGSITTERELYARLAPFAAILKDGHTELQRSETAQRGAGATKLLPLELYLLGDRLWVRRSHAADVTAGAEVLAIDDEAVVNVIRRVRAAEPRDGNSEGGPRYTLSRRFRFVRQLAALDGERDTYRLTVRQPGPGDSVRLQVMSVALRTLQQSAGTAPDSGGLLSLTTVENIPVLRLRAFGSGLEAQLRDAVRTVIERKSPALIVDVRGNGGGMDALGLQLFAHLASGPFQYYKSLRVRTLATTSPLLKSVELPRLTATRDADGWYRTTTHPNLGTHKPDAVNYRGRVVVLMDGGSFSTTAEFLAAVRASGRATFVGEESGGAECGNTSGRSTVVLLPNSGLHLQLPLIRYDTAIACDGHGRGVMPDVAIPVTVQDLLAGRDPQMARALQIAQDGSASSRGRPSGISSETPAWSPDGRRIAFSAGPAMQHQIYVMAADGSGAVRLTEGPEQNRWPSWSPDGRSIVFMSDRDGQAELYVMRVDGSEQRRLTQTPVHEFAPAWSPRGDTIFYVVEMPGSRQQLFRMNPDGTGVHRIDGDHLYYGRGAWAADGSAFYIGAHREPGTAADARWKVQTRIYRFGCAGEAPAALDIDGYASNPAPSPDGRAIVFDAGNGSGWSSANGEWDLWIADAPAGRQRRRLTAGSTNDWGAAWSPDGTRIAFSSGRDRVYAIVVVAADGSGRRVLTQTDRLPDAR